MNDLFAYTAPVWLPGGHLQTIWPALHSRRFAEAHESYRRTRWTTPDQDFIDVDWLDAHQGEPGPPMPRNPLLVLFHGLEGNSQSHYARAFAQFSRQQGWNYVVPHFRGCSGEINLAPRAYHSGDHEEVDWILRRLKTQYRGPIVAVGVSLGGNALLRWAQESGCTAEEVVHAVCAVCAPTDLTASGMALGQGFNKFTYTPMFLNTMKPKALLKLRQHPGLFSQEALLSSRNLYDFDNVFTAPLHGFKDTQDYWSRASSKPRLQALLLPTLIVHAHNDPFVPAWSLPVRQDVGANVTLWQPRHGGHVGFSTGRPPGSLHCLPSAVGQWLQQHIA
ncbi:alpha/beta fold hydrolase [Rhodoferax sp. GW822-FHT02A01]|uniref:YheT family hydrolase n=1 Tax=Rhodoferax sp. GW822-FHT02A01 TaxID=3141537 RepID=UPI00315D6325